MNMTGKFLITAATVLFLVFLAAAGQLADDVPSLDDRADLEAFIDGIMHIHLASHHIAGATLSIVKDGRVFLAKGYGFADVEKQTPVSPERTLFRPGSVSKLITWTAVMQLVSEGKIDLNADINSYLKSFQIPEAFDKPVTMANLMTHTPGFEDVLDSMAKRKAEDLMPLKEFLIKNLP